MFFFFLPWVWIESWGLPASLPHIMRNRSEHLFCLCTAWPMTVHDCCCNTTKAHLSAQLHSWLRITAIFHTFVCLQKVLSFSTVCLDWKLRSASPSLLSSPTFQEIGQRLRAPVLPLRGLALLSKQQFDQILANSFEDDYWNWSKINGDIDGCRKLILL